MPNTTLLRKAVLATLLVATAAMAQTPYDEGQKALREQDWKEAIEQFEDAKRSNDSQADAATYWLAYSYFKANRNAEAERELRHLERRYPDSPWLKEAQVLRIEHRPPPPPPKPAAPPAPGDFEMDEEMRLFALMQLMERDPARTLPLVLNLVHNGKSAKTRRDALFLLAMSDEEAAREPLMDIARNAGDAELQREAINMLGVMEATAELQSLYLDQDRYAKTAIIESLGIAGDTAALRRILETETDPELRKAAIFGIAMHGDADAAEFGGEIYRSSKTTDEKIAVLESLVMMDDASELALEILRTETDPRLQVHAIHILGVMDATDELAGLYDSMKDRNVRVAILEAMSIAEDSSGLVKILESETDPKLRATAVQSLAVNGSPEAAAYLVDMYAGASRDEKMEIIHSMLILEDPDALLTVMKQESDPALKKEMLQMLVVMGSEAVDEQLFELLENEQ